VDPWPFLLIMEKIKRENQRRRRTSQSVRRGDEKRDRPSVKTEHPVIQKRTRTRVSKGKMNESKRRIQALVS